MDKKQRNFLAQARSWLTKNDLHGPHAFLRFVSLVFVQRLNQAGDEFIFKGGNLLWVYIRTPRATRDIDFVTRTLCDHDSVKKTLETACHVSAGNIAFRVTRFDPVLTQGSKGASVTISCRTAEGQENTFDLDIVYAVPSDVVAIPSPLQNGELIQVVTIENIIADKLAAAHRHRSGNSRMKDFDDLWRISKVVPDPVNWLKLRSLLAERDIPDRLDPAWIGAQMERSWQSHVKRNRDLPGELTTAILAVNEWLGSGLVTR